MKRTVRVWERDYRIINDLEHGLYSTGQLEQLYFPSRKKCSERMKRLFSAGFVSRFSKPLLDVRGKPEFVYCKKGKVVRGFVRVNHALAVSDFRVSFLLWLKSNKKFCGDFFYCSQLPGNLLGGSLKPDAVCTVQNNKTCKKLLYLVEVDLGSESLVGDGYGFADKLDLYSEYFDSGRFRDDFGWLGSFRSFRLLVVFGSGERMSNFLKIAEGKGADFVLSSTLENVKQDFGGGHWQDFKGGCFAVFG